MQYSSKYVGHLAIIHFYIAADGGQVVPGSQALENTKQIETEVNLAYGTASSGVDTEGRQCADGEASYEYIT